MFITFEGPEGAGKTTQAARLAERLRASGRTCVLTREPGGTPLGDHVRALLLLKSDVAMAARTEALLLGAARAQVVDEVIRPALARGDTVVADRYADSTLAYQGYGRGLGLAALRSVIAFATGGLTPDLTFLLNVPATDGLERKRQLSAEEWNRFEQEGLAFHERVRAGFLELAAAEPRRWVVVDAMQPIATIEQHIWTNVVRRLRHGAL